LRAGLRKLSSNRITATPALSAVVLTINLIQADEDHERPLFRSILQRSWPLPPGMCRESRFVPLLTSFVVASALSESREIAKARITTWNLQWFPNGSAHDTPLEIQAQRIEAAAD
jgi:hypothetical protein